VSTDSDRDLVSSDGEVIAVRFQLRTLQVLVAVAAAPIWVLDAGIKYGCPYRVLRVWGALVAVPLLLMGLVLPCIRTEPARKRVLALFGAIVIVGYLIAIPGSLLAIGIPIP
jgi:hypothetical protein